MLELSPKPYHVGIKQPMLYLSDQTKISDTTWGELKESALQEEYIEQNWYKELKPDEKELLEALRIAQ